MVSQHDLAQQRGLAVHPEKKTLVHFACEVSSLIHRVRSDVNAELPGFLTGCGGNCDSGVLEVPAQHLDLMMVGNDDHVVAVLYHRDLAKHPNVLIQSEDSQD